MWEGASHKNCLDLLETVDLDRGKYVTASVCKHIFSRTTRQKLTHMPSFETRARAHTHPRTRAQAHTRTCTYAHMHTNTTYNHSYLPERARIKTSLCGYPEHGGRNKGIVELTWAFVASFLSSDWRRAALRCETMSSKPASFVLGLICGMCCGVDTAPLVISKASLLSFPCTVLASPTVEPLPDVGVTPEAS